MKTFSCTLPLGVPSLKNNKRILTNRATGKPFIASSTANKSWRKDAVLILRAYRNAQIGVGNCFTECDVSLFVTDKSKRKYDLSNKAETIMDALVDAGVIADDNRFCVRCLHLLNRKTPNIIDDGWEIIITGEIGETE